MLLYHHCRTLESIVYGTVRPSPEHAIEWLKEEYIWLEKEVGFYPLFLAVGGTEDDIRMTGYDTQWNKRIGTEIVGRKKNGNCIQKNVLRKKGEFPNEVLFSFDDFDKLQEASTDGVFMDYMAWHIVLNSSHCNYQISEQYKRMIFKYSWPKSKWLNYAKKEPHNVQLVTKELYLPAAKQIWARNNPTKAKLEEMGFRNVEVKRIYVYRD